MYSKIHIECLTKSSKNIGKIIKATKKQYTWEFILEDKKYTVDLLSSKLSHKIRVYVNCEKFFKKITKEIFKFEFYLQLHMITIKQRKKSFVLLIDGFLFRETEKIKKSNNENFFENNICPSYDTFSSENSFDEKKNCCHYCFNKKKKKRKNKNKKISDSLRLMNEDDNFSNFSDITFTSKSNLSYN